MRAQMTFDLPYDNSIEDMVEGHVAEMTADRDHWGREKIASFIETDATTEELPRILLSALVIYKATRAEIFEALETAIVFERG